MAIVLQGSQGKTLTVEADVVKIEKKGLLAGKREKTIAIRNISSVEVKKPGMFAGFIQFSIAGGAVRDSSYTVTGGAVDAAKDENSVLFNNQDKYDLALKVKSYVENWQAQRHAVSQIQPTASSAADEIRKLKALVDEGLLTNEEFNLKKQQLLGL